MPAKTGLIADIWFCIDLQADHVSANITGIRGGDDRSCWAENGLTMLASRGFWPLTAAAIDPEAPLRVALGDRDSGEVHVLEAGGANP
jgi:hypothetical protein